jgi:hypothetical protein
MSPKSTAAPVTQEIFVQIQGFEQAENHLFRGQNGQIRRFDRETAGARIHCRVLPGTQ